MKRPKSHHGSCVTTPSAAGMIELLGAGAVQGGVALTRDQFWAIGKIYGFKREQPNQKPPAPTPPEAPAPGAEYPERRKYEEALKAHEAALKAHASWTDPRPLMQAGADRNTLREAECDGLRLLAWLAKYVPVGEDPVKTLVQLASDSGWDVDNSDVEWAEDEVEA